MVRRAARGLTRCAARPFAGAKERCMRHGVHEREVWKSGAKQAVEASKLSQEAKEDAGHSGDTSRHRHGPQVSHSS